MTMQVWHYPTCSKSNRAIDDLDAAGFSYELRDYVDQPPSVDELYVLARKLGAEPWQFCRTGEPVAVELGLRQWPRDESQRDRWLRALRDNPILIQRPIVVCCERAVIARESGWLRSLEG